MLNYSDFGIKLNSSKTNGEVVTTCPQCSHTRKKSKDKCLSVNLTKRVWNCNHCGWKGSLRPEIEKVVYFKPEWKNKTELSEKAVKWFEGRGISQRTLKEMKISEGKEWMPQTQKEENTVQFNYFEGETLINTKYRDGAKNFKLVKDADKIPYNVNALLNPEFKDIIIVEGEMDALSYIEAGVPYVISVPNGAQTGENNLSYLNRFIDAFDTKDRVFIATDKDNAGRSLKNDLAARLGHSKCYWIDWGKYKDANEVLQNEGINGFHAIGLKAKEFEIVGSLGVESFYDDVFDLYQNGLDMGKSINDGVLDDNLRFTKGYITTITGIPSHGKSEYLDHIITHLIVNANWIGAYYSPENKPTELHISKLIRKLSGKSWYGNNKILASEVQFYLSFLTDKIWFITPPKGFKLDDILSSVKELKQRKNIDFFVIDAWNKLEHIDDSSTYVGKSYDQIAMFCEENKIHCFMVAHPTKMPKSKETGLFEVPNLYSINGSANFFNKTDNGISVYRRFDQSNPEHSWTEVYIQKVKFGHWGKVGMVDYEFDVNNLRYRNRQFSEMNIPMVKREENKLEINDNFNNEIPY